MPRRGGGWPRETVLPHSGKPTPPRFARLHLPEEGARNRCHSRSGTRASPTYATHFSAFLICLSCRLCPIRPFGAPSPRGEGCRYEGKLPSQTFGHHTYIFAAKPPPSFLIPNSSFAQSFHSESVDGTAPRADPPRKEPRHGSLTVPHQYGHHSLSAGAFFLYQPAAGKLRTSRDLPKIREGEEDPDARP